MNMITRPSRSEGTDDYHAVVARLNPRWRVIVCAQGMQWILQYRASAETYSTSRWQSRSYARTDIGKTDIAATWTALRGSMTLNSVNSPG
jgi:hypothetical protein